jgi:hypothetical protein
MSLPTTESFSPSLDAHQNDLTRVIPRLLPGNLLGRHVATLKADDLLVCGWCSGPFVEGDDIMLDVYQHDGLSTTQIVVEGVPLDAWKKTSIVMFHANKSCLTNACDRVTQDYISRVQVSSHRRTLPVPDLAELVYTHFKWAIQWVAWHYQFLADDCIELTLGSRRAPLTEGVCPSFLFDMAQEHESECATVVVAPVRMFTREFVESMFTRTYEYDLVYKGEYNPFMQLRNAFESQCWPAHVEAYVHSLVATRFSADASSTIRMRLIVKMKPIHADMDQLMQLYQNENVAQVTWARLEQHTRMVRMNFKAEDQAVNDDHPFDWVLLRIASSYSEAWSTISKCLATAGVEHTGKPQNFHTLTSIVITHPSPQRTIISCLSNVHIPNKAPMPRYFFKEDADNEQQPLYCYEGVLLQATPVLFSNVRALEEEMKDAGLTKLDMPQLTVLLPATRVSASASASASALAE